ncbi:MAG: hypothetical protein R6W82_04335 [bacterium]
MTTMKMHPAKHAGLLTALTLLLLLPAAARTRSAAAQDRSPGQARQEAIEERIIELQRSLASAVERMEEGEETLGRVRRELARLDEEVEELGEGPEVRALRRRIMTLRRELTEASLRRSFAPIPDVAEIMRDIDPEIRIRLGEEGIQAFGGTTSRRDIFQIGDDVEVGMLEKVRGDVVVIGGRVTVRGSVTGNVVSVGSDVRVTSTGRIEGDAVTIGGNIIQEAGGVIQGSMVDTLWPRAWMWGPNQFVWFAFHLATFVFVLVAALMVGLVLPRNVGQVEHTVRTRFGGSFLLGLGALVLLPVVFFLLLITIVGIPVALILLPVAVIGLYLLGFTGVSQAVGRGLQERGMHLGSSQLALIAVGVIALELLFLVGRSVGVLGGLLGPLAFAVRMLGFLVLFVAWTTGLGAALLTRFGTRRPGAPSEPKPAPPPAGAGRAV